MLQLKIWRLKKLKVFDNLRLSIVVAIEVLTDILADILMDITAEAITGQED